MDYFCMLCSLVNDIIQYLFELAVSEQSSMCRVYQVHYFQNSARRSLQIQVIEIQVYFAVARQ